MAALLQDARITLGEMVYDPDEGRFLFNSFLVGGGFTQRIGLNNAVTFMVLWNLNESYSSPYSNPLFRIGFNAYF